MNALTETRDDGIQFTQSGDDSWNVIVDGQQAGSIEREGRCFIAWSTFRTYCNTFQKALDTIAERARWLADQNAEQQRKHDEAVASLMRMTPAQKQRAIAKLEEERARLEYAASHIEVGRRTAEINRQIAWFRGEAA